MQMPILTYPNFSQFLQLHQQQQLKQQQQQQQYLQVDGLGSETSVDTSSSPSPPLSPSLSLRLSVPDKSLPRKSFTIDAILGLRDSTERDSMAFHSAFHPRLHLPSVLTREQPPPFSSSRHSLDKPLGESSKKSSGKSKRVRTIFTPEQLERLEAEFERQQYMVGPERLYLAHTLQLTEAQVKVWFQNRRIKWRKQHLELQQQRLSVLKQRQRGDADDSDDSEDSTAAVPTNFTQFPHDAGSSENFFPLSFPPVIGSRNTQESDQSCEKD